MSANMTSLITVPLHHYLAQTGALPSGTWRVALLANTYVENKDHKFLSDVQAHEISGTGYSTGGPAVPGLDCVADDANDRNQINHTQIVLPAPTNLTARFGFYYLDTAGAATTDPAGFVIDYGSDITSTGGAFTIPALSTPVRINT